MNEIEKEQLENDIEFLKKENEFLKERLQENQCLSMCNNICTGWCGIQIPE